MLSASLGNVKKHHGLPKLRATGDHDSRVQCPLLHNHLKPKVQELCAEVGFRRIRRVPLDNPNAAWEELFHTTRNPVFETEESFACGDRCITRWVFFWDNPDGTRRHVRGVDVWRVRDGKVAELRAYVKG